MDIKEKRRQNLLLLIKENSSQKNLAKRLEKANIDESYLSQMKTGSRSIGEKTARNIELCLNLPNLWMDGDLDHKTVAAIDEELDQLIDQAYEAGLADDVKAQIRLILKLASKD
jgi:transcriptional regulator with XRE-family HTH domain